MTQKFITGEGDAAIVSFVAEGRLMVLPATHPSYEAVLEALGEDPVDEAEVIRLATMQVGEVLAKHFDSLVQGSVHLHWDPVRQGLEIGDSSTVLPYSALKVLVRTIEPMVPRVPMDVIAAFLRSLVANPDRSCRLAVVDWIEEHGLELGEDGSMIHFKGVTDELRSIHGGRNPAKVVGPGGREELVPQGRLPYLVGTVVEIERSICRPGEPGCSVGIHVGARELGLQYGSKTVLVAVKPEDVVSGQSRSAWKLRASRVRVVAEL